MKVKWSDNGFTINLSVCDISDWVRTPGAAWPCSTLDGKRLYAEFDSNGLLDYSINGRSANCDVAEYDIDSHEFNAIIADHAKEVLPTDHPCYFVAVGQFQG